MADKACVVVITSFDRSRKIQAIKRIREVTGLGLADANSILQDVPSILMNGMYPEQADPHWGPNGLCNDWDSAAEDTFSSSPHD